MRNESDLGICKPTVHLRPSYLLASGFESEYTRCDPKDSELCLQSAKPGEILVEVRRDTDVQIVLEM